MRPRTTRSSQQHYAMSFLYVDPGHLLLVVPINACGCSLSRLRIRFNFSCLFLGYCWCPFPCNFSPLHLTKGSQVCVFIALPSCVSLKRCAKDVYRRTPSSLILLLLVGYLKAEKWSVARIAFIFFFPLYGWCSSLHCFFSNTWHTTCPYMDPQESWIKLTKGVNLKRII